MMDEAELELSFPRVPACENIPAGCCLRTTLISDLKVSAQMDERNNSLGLSTRIHVRLPDLPYHIYLLDKAERFGNRQVDPPRMLSKALTSIGISRLCKTDSFL